MTIEAHLSTAAITTVENTPSQVAAPVKMTTPVVSSQAATAAAPSVDAAALRDAQRQLEEHFSKTNPPQFNVDYLSGLGVMTVRAAITGEVIFQIPDMQAVHLAQLLKEGAPVESLGILNTVA